jgi:hypothetical protein
MSKAKIRASGHKVNDNKSGFFVIMMLNFLDFSRDFWNKGTG